MGYWGSDKGRQGCCIFLLNEELFGTPESSKSQGSWRFLCFASLCCYFNPKKKLRLKFSGWKCLIHTIIGRMKDWLNEEMVLFGMIRASVKFSKLHHLGDAGRSPRSKRQADMDGAWCKTPKKHVFSRFFCFDMAFKVIQLKVVKMGIQMIVEKQNCEMIVIFENARGWLWMMTTWSLGL